MTNYDYLKFIKSLYDFADLTFYVKPVNSNKNGGVVTLYDTRVFINYGAEDGSDDRYFSIDEFNENFIITKIDYE